MNKTKSWCYSPLIQIPSLFFSDGWFHYKGSVTDLPAEGNLSWSVWHLWLLCYSELQLHNQILFLYFSCSFWTHQTPGCFIVQSFRYKKKAEISHLALVSCDSEFKHRAKICLWSSNFMESEWEIPAILAIASTTSCRTTGTLSPCFL